MMQMRTFTDCPECGANFTTRGMPRHRQTQHGVAPIETGTKIKPREKTLAERLAAIDAWNTDGE